MNPLALLLFAAAAGNGRHTGIAASPVKLDTVLEQLHGAVSALEKVNELSRMGTSAPVPFSLPASSSAHIPVSAQPPDEPEYSPQPQPPAPPSPNFDIQGALQALGPILSMLGNNQGSR